MELSAKLRLINIHEQRCHELRRSSDFPTWLSLVPSVLNSGIKPLCPRLVQKEQTQPSAQLCHSEALSDTSLKTQCASCRQCYTDNRFYKWPRSCYLHLEASSVPDPAGSTYSLSKACGRSQATDSPRLKGCHRHHHHPRRPLSRPSLVRPCPGTHPRGQEARIPSETHLLEVLINGDVRHNSIRGR